MSRLRSVYSAGVAFAQRASFRQRNPGGHITQNIVRRGLVGKNFGHDAARQQPFEQVNGIGGDAHGKGAFRFCQGQRAICGGVQAVNDFIQQTDFLATGEFFWIHVGDKAGAAVHRHREGLGAAHAAAAGGDRQPSCQVAAEMLPGAFGEGFVGALQNSLGADVNPRAGGHLAVHDQAAPVEFVEVRLGRPMRHQVAVGDEHARGVRMGAQDAHRFARLHEQRFVGFELSQTIHDGIESLP